MFNVILKLYSSVVPSVFPAQLRILQYRRYSTSSIVPITGTTKDRMVLPSMTRTGSRNIYRNGCTLSP
jgi:hypothetical protein